jgi:cephalosporin hydroxylase
MIKKIIILFLFCSSNFLFAQNDIDYKSLVGFACFSDGQASESVKKVNKLLLKSQYSKILNLLDSENNAEKYLAVIVSEKLEKLDKIE